MTINHELDLPAAGCKPQGTDANKEQPDGSYRFRCPRSNDGSGPSPDRPDTLHNCLLAACWLRIKVWQSVRNVCEG
uniref:Uncharacterized protein n=1 Tax=Panagrellus redivivus TaxID=6233 RepID=A0A7E4VN51_PANRE